MRREEEEGGGGGAKEKMRRSVSRFLHPSIQTAAPP